MLLNGDDSLSLTIILAIPAICFWTYFSFTKNRKRNKFKVKVFNETKCYFIRDAFDLKEQEDIFAYIKEKDKTPYKKPAMFSSAKTILFGPMKPSLPFVFGEKSVVNRIIEKTNGILYDGLGIDLRNYTEGTMSAIEYTAPKHRFPPHVDHCNDNSYVYLVSLGCTANFMVKGPNMSDKEVFKFNSGDMLVFDPSTEANILHEVKSIDENTCPPKLAETYPLLENTRYGMQHRVRYSNRG